MDISKAQERLRFEPEISIELSIEMTVDWYKKFLFEGIEARELVLSQIEQFSALIIESSAIAKKKFLIIGGTGFIGGALVRALINMDETVHCLAFADRN